MIGSWRPALALLEFSSIAIGIEAGDAMVKRGPVDVVAAGTVHPGHYLVLVAGEVAAVEEAVSAGLAVAGGSLLDSVLLPDVHPEVVAAVRGTRRETAGEALGVVETATVAGTIRAADAGVKGAAVVLRELRLADGLGGKGYVLFGGAVADVDAAVAVAGDRAAGSVVASRVIARLHAEMEENLGQTPRFGERVRD